MSADTPSGDGDPRRRQRSLDVSEITLENVRLGKLHMGWFDDRVALHFRLLA